MISPREQQLLDALRSILPEGMVLTDIEPRYMGDWLIQAGPEDTPLAVVRPKTTEQVSHLMRACHAHGVPVVPQGGRTGLTGGATPMRGWIALSLEYMNVVEAPDVVGQTMIVGAGVPLQRVQEEADAVGLKFPLDIGSRGSCQIGGNISTNAGGNHVLRYGMARQLILGLEVVLADGTIVNALNTMLKNNSGYDLKHLFIGSEGTLGIVTRAALRLVAKPQSTAVALCAFKDYAQLEALLQRCRIALGDELSAFEVMWPTFYDVALNLLHKAPPLPAGSGAYALIENASSSMDAEAHLGAFLEQMFEAGLVEDATLAQSLAQSDQIWAIRDSSGEIAQVLAPVGNFDVSVPTRVISQFVPMCHDRLHRQWPDAVLNFFGHVVDGNIHLIAGGVPEAELHAFEEAVFEVVRHFGGSISAEHGIGLHKLDFLHYSRTAEEIELMRRIKRALDPTGILNPGKVIRV
jgi:FAD/FMN-containing dehydrogenase